MLRKIGDMVERAIENCHGGQGTVNARMVVKRGDSEVGLSFVHDDTLEPGVTIGEHPHADNEEAYYVVEGTGTLILDGEEHPVGPGDISICHEGHTHGIANTGSGVMRLIVIGLKEVD